MKHSYLWLVAYCVAQTAAAASGDNVADTLRNVNIEEAIVVASPKETTTFQRQPISVSILGENALSLTGATALKGVASYAPNFFMPDYGSRITSAAYVRGIGSRIGTPAVGLYVDNVPVIDKSAYDFSFLDVVRVDVLRGPQATLYGRNAMAGLVRVYTADPLTHRGTDISIGATSRTTGRRIKAVTYLHPTDAFALSLGGFYEGENGFYRNATTGEKADGSNAAGGKVRAAWRPKSSLRLDLSAAYEYSDEDACPYFLSEANRQTATAELEGKISQNRPSAYRREMLTSGLDIEWTAKDFILSSITSFQYLRDRLFMDQDFVATDVFSLTQRQRMATLSEELVIKSHHRRRWQWVAGAFLMHQNLTTTCPVTFYGDGVDYLNDQFAAVLPQSPAMSVAFTSETLPFNARLSTPTTNIAFFHQSTLSLGAGLSLVAGLRLDYDHTHLRLNAFSDAPMTYRFTMPSFSIDQSLVADPALTGRLTDDTWQLLPKLALQYNHRSGRGNVYVAVSKGYRAGGYNIQSYSELSQTMLRRVMMLGVRDLSVATINQMPLPDAIKEKAIAGMTSTLDPQIPAEPDLRTLAYAPEQSWNYEVGGHLKFFGNALRVDYTLFYMHTKDQQIAHFAESGFGRIMVNAGKARSLGAELTLRTTLMDDRLNLTAAYGFTDARFTDYYLGEQDGQRVDYEDNHVPFAPTHTLGATAAFRQPLSGRALRAVGVAATVNGAGRFYWDEANTFSQPFYALLGLSLSAELGECIDIALWGRNLTATRYATFAFQSMNNRFAQCGTPRCFGVDVNIHF